MTGRDRTVPYYDEKKRFFISGSVPVWKANLVVFGMLIVVVLAYFFFQVRQAEKIFLKHVKEHAGMVAGVVRLNAAGAVLSRELVEEIMQTFLENSAHFIDYLDSVEAFTENELTALAKETGLSGIRITTNGGEVREGPKGWFPESPPLSPHKENRLRHIKDKGLFYLRFQRLESGSLIVGITSQRFETLQKKIGLPALIKTLTGVEKIKYVRIETSSPPPKINPEAGEVLIIGTGRNKTAEARLPLGSHTIVVGMDARRFFTRVDRLWYEFFTFSGIIALAGLFCSWLLYNYQKAQMKQAQNFERKLAREREDAALGRATASITHEIRNPLNAISMGLQRLLIEGAKLNQEQTDLIESLVSSVKRADRIVADLKKYTGPLSPKKHPLPPHLLINNLLTLYGPHFSKNAIVLNYSADFKETISADPDLLEILVENLVKNAVEAQKQGGYLNINLSRQDNDLCLVFENGGFENRVENPELLLEPYYTTKTRGSGLGLTMVKRIIDAHNGTIHVKVPGRGVLEIKILIPLSGV